MKTIKLITIIGLSLALLSSCIDEPTDQDILNPYSEVGSSAELSIPTGADLWIDPSTSSTTFVVEGGDDLSDITALEMGVVSVTADAEGNTVVSPVSKLRDITDIAGLGDGTEFTVSGTEMLSALGISASDLVPGNRLQIVFTKTIGGKQYKDRASHSVLISCPSDIPTGAYTVAGSTTEVMITSDGAGVYTISNLNFNYYSTSYGDIPAKFLDVCNDLTLLGFNEGTAYGIAWIGSGTYTPAEGANKATLSFTYSDQTYNPNFEASITFVQN